MERDGKSSLRHPSSDSRFDAKREHVIYYLSHPLAPDDEYTFQQNMDHVVHLIRLFYEEGWHVIAPYHTICLALPDDNIEYRITGLEVDCNVCRKIGNVILTGHKFSSGMRHEFEQAMTCRSGGIIHNFIGYNDDELRVALRYLRNGGSLESSVQAPL